MFVKLLWIVCPEPPYDIVLCLALDYTFTYHRIDLAPPQKTCLNFGRLATKGKVKIKPHENILSRNH